MDYRYLSFSNAAPITIPAEGHAAPYPASILVSGVTGQVAKVTVTLSRLEHAWPSDLDVVVVGPSGQAVLVMSDAGGDRPTTNLTLTFDDAAPAPLPAGLPLSSGTFQPTDYAGDEIFWDLFDAPAPPGAHPSQLALFNGLEANGRWELFVMDNVAYDGGQILGGWSLMFTLEQPLLNTTSTNSTHVGPGSATAEARSATMIAVQAPFTGDDNQNGSTTYEVSAGPQGPWTTSGVYMNNIPGPAEWRASAIQVTAGSISYIRVTFTDPDGVVGPSQQIVGPVATPSFSPPSAWVEPVLVEARDTEIYVSVPIRDDANWDSSGSIFLATNAAGPWIKKCSNLPFHPKRGRLRSLTPGTEYWVRVTVTDPDGVSGAGDQVVGPVRYTGLRNLAYNQPASADPGWGCCPNPQQLVDGFIQDEAWYYGFAWTGGNAGWAGGLPGWKQATIDLGSLSTFNRAAVWFHGSDDVPLVWKFQYSLDGATWLDAHSTTNPMGRTATQMLWLNAGYPSCAQDARFDQPVVGRYFRYTFDDRTLFNNLHGWVQEIEVFGEANAATAPLIAQQPQSVLAAVGSNVSLSVVIASPIPVTYQWQLNGTNLAGGTNATLWLNTISAADGGSYLVVVSNRFGSVTSTPALLTIQPFAPTWDVVRITGLPDGCVLGRLWARGREDVFVLANRSTPASTSAQEAYLFHWDGTNWTLALHVPGVQGAYVFGTGNSELFVSTWSGSAGQLFRSEDNGVSWGEDPLPWSNPALGLGKITGTPGNVHMMTGYDASLIGYVMRFDGTNWSVVYTSPYDAPPRGLTVLSSKEGYYTGCWGWGKWDGAQWRWHGWQFDFCDVTDCWGMRDGQGALQLYTVGGHNFADGIYVWKFDEASQSFRGKYSTVFGDGGTAGLGYVADIWGSAPDNIYVTGELSDVPYGERSGRIYHFDGMNWRRVTEFGVIPPVGGMTGTGASDVWVSLTDGRLLHLQSARPPGPPVILRQPQSIYALSNSTVSFDVQVGDAMQIAYQWFFNGNQAIPGATSAVLAVTATNPTGATYSVAVTTAGGSVTSQVATLTILAPPRLVEPPRSVQTNAGAMVTFSVLASGEPLLYQWRLNGVNLPGATESWLAFSNVQPADGGSYSVVVANPVGVAFSETVQLVVSDPTAQALTNDFFAQAVPLTNLAGFLPSGSVAGANRCTSKETGEPNHAGRNGGRSVWFSWTAPAVGIATFDTQGSSFDTVLAVYTGAEVSHLEEVASDDDTGPSLTSRLQFNAQIGANYHLALDGFAGQSGDYVLNWSLEATMEQLPLLTAQPQSQAVSNGATASFAVAANGDRFQWFQNGEAVAHATNATYVISGVTSDHLGSYHAVVSNAHRSVESRRAALEVGIAPSDNKPEEIFAPLYTGNCPGGAVRSNARRPKTTQMPNLAVALGTSGLHLLNNIALPVSLGGDCQYYPGVGTSWLLFQMTNQGTLWLNTRRSEFPVRIRLHDPSDPRDFVVLACATNEARYEITDFTHAYWLGLESPDGKVGLIQLDWAFDIAPPPVDVNDHRLVPRGDTVSFCFGATNEAFCYQWQLNHLNIPGATNSCYMVTNVQPVDAGTYTVVVSSQLPAVTNNVGELEVQSPPEVTLQPAATQEVYEGHDVSFTMVVSGDPPLSYQWFNTNGPIPAETNTTLTLRRVGLTNAGRYWLLASNPHGSATSREARLTVRAPHIKLEPSLVEAAGCHSNRFVAIWSNECPTNCLWVLDGVARPEMTGTNFVLAAGSLCKPGEHRIEVKPQYAFDLQTNQVLGVAVLKLTQAAPVVLADWVLDGSKLRLKVESGRLGWAHRVEACTNLTEAQTNQLAWVPLPMNLTNGYYDVARPSHWPQAFYRAVADPPPDSLDARTP